MKVLVLDRRFKNPTKIKEIKKLALLKFNNKSYYRLKQLYNLAGGAVFTVAYQKSHVMVEVKKSKSRR